MHNYSIDEINELDQNSNDSGNIFGDSINLNLDMKQHG